MSPSEFDLRAALRDGEGDVPNPTLIIAQVARARYERRRRVMTVASSVAVAAAVVTGISLLVRMGSGTESAGGAGGAAASAPALARPQHGYAGGGASAAQSSGEYSVEDRAAQKAAALSCPTKFPKQRPSDWIQHSGPLFSEPVAAMKVCAYDLFAHLTERSYARTDAARIATTLEAEPADVPDPTLCKHYPDFLVYPVGTSGTAEHVVVGLGGCAQYQFSNGTATRSASVEQVRTLFPALSAPQEQGSPLKS